MARRLTWVSPVRWIPHSAVVIPNIVAAAGSVLAVSTKRDVLDITAPARQQLGECSLFDPSGTIRSPLDVAPVGWSPVTRAANWDHAVLVAEAMVGASRPQPTLGNSAHWTERAAALLATMFHGAALEERSMRDVVGAVNRREPEQFLSALSLHSADQALDLLLGIIATDARELSGIWSTASGVLAAYRTEGAIASSEITALDVNAFIRSRAALYICAPAEHQHHLAPLVAGMIRDVRSACYQLHQSRDSVAFSSDSVGRPPMLLVLDELANIAPLHDLPTLIAEGASQGVLTLACLQDLSQARARWGVAADGFLSLFGAKLVLSGIGDERTLRALSLISGDYDEQVVSRTRHLRTQGSFRPSSRTVSVRKTARLPADAIAQLSKNAAIALIGATPGRIELTPYYSTTPWREAVNAPTRLVSRRPHYPPPKPRTYSKGKDQPLSS